MNLDLSTIIIFAQDVNRLKAFYVNILGLQILEETRSEWLLLKAGNCNIGLHKIGKQYQTNAEYKFDNNTKVVFDISEDIYNFRENLLAKDVIVSAIKTFDGYEFLICDGEDPEGNVFQLRQRKK